MWYCMRLQRELWHDATKVSRFSGVSIQFDLNGYITDWVWSMSEFNGCNTAWEMNPLSDALKAWLHHIAR